MKSLIHVNNGIKELMDIYLRNDKGELNILGKLLSIIFIILVLKTIIKLINKIIDKTLANKKGDNFFVDKRRATTIGQVLKRIVKYILYFIGIMMILDMFNINTSSILATAGIGGLAIGFGAQSLVKDIITGFFILFEDQFAVGDYINIEGLEGIVEELGLRVTKLRDFSGELHIIPNGKIQVVTNKTRGAMRALVKINISYEENMDKINLLLGDVCRNMKSENESILDGPTILGITELGESSISITIVAKTKPMEQWAVEREIRKRIRETFQKENINIPYPKTVILRGENDDTKI